MTVHPKNGDEPIVVEDPYPTLAAAIEDTNDFSWHNSYPDVAELNWIVEHANDKPRMQLICSTLDATGAFAGLSSNDAYQASSAVAFACKGSPLVEYPVNRRLVEMTPGEYLRHRGREILAEQSRDDCIGLARALNVVADVVEHVASRQSTRSKRLLFTRV